ncbi:hypothetical protein DEAC_c30350 [Desulfosporosinus acididurans]|uniref:DUF115 domain-containing protein n=1 Tax=Desulfosporosinus acididurans TaxID=476652 RepID=A0A0J1FQ35_9FIRM|nr:6-hydroxymethylpterin diphosphokinase MptE-like protein [Desulfosporosinus acididurans]KLU65068.1 hypothetical protein DEAC_c30350 [Desulfosporosinus acididurans]
MMLYRKNFRFLLTQGFEACKLTSQEPSSVRVMTGKKGYLTGVKQIGGQDILLHSSYDPITEASRLITGKKFPANSSIFVLGLGLGYHLAELLNQTSPESMIFVLETDWDMIRAAMQVIDFQEIVSTGRVILAFGSLPEIRAILNDVFKIEDLLLKLFKIDFLTFAPKLNCENQEVQGMRRLVQEALNNHYLVMNHEIDWMLRRLRNTVEHVPYLARAPYPSQIADTWHKPVVIVLAGPSLDKNIDVLKEWQDRVTIFCVNTVFNRLMDDGIIPDAAFSIDIQPDLAERHYRRQEPIPKSIVFVANPGVDPRCISLFQQNLLILGGGGYFQHELAHDMGSEVMSLGLSVAHFAFIVARHIGAAPIILIGQDLAFGDQGQTHGVDDEHNTMLSTSSDRVFLEGYHGGEVSSCLTWKLFRDWYEDYLEKYPSLVINATEGGVKIKGTRQLPLNEALEQYVGINSATKDSFADWLQSMQQTVPYVEMLNRIRRSFAKRIEKLRESESACSLGMKLSKNIEDPEMPLKAKQGYLQHMENEVRNMMKDRWLFYTFRSEFIRVMSVYFDWDGKSEAPEMVIISKAKLLQDLFVNLGSLLLEFRKVMETAQYPDQ